MCVLSYMCVRRSVAYGRTCPSFCCDSCRASRCASACPRRRADERTWRGRSSNTELCLPVRLAATRLAVSRLPPGDRRACANEADEKVNIYESLASLHHSRVIFANPAWIKVAERSGVCLERRVRRMQRLNMVMPPPPPLCAAETFSSTLTSEEENSGMGGIAMLTLSDTESNLHFILILQGLIRHSGKGEEGAVQTWIWLGS